MVAALVVGILAGCSRGEPVVRYHFNGKITHAGRPVSAGEMLFTPDDTVGNRGPQGLAEIREGVFDTRGSRAPGGSGGQMIVQVTARIDPQGTTFVKHRFTIDLPYADHSFDIDIPASAERVEMPVDN